MTYEEVILLRKQLEKDEISCEDAKVIYFADKKLSWHTKDWNERRKIILKDKCEQCGSTETLTLQHFTHPPNYQTIQKTVFQQYYERFLIENEANLESVISKNDIIEYIQKIPREIKKVCPICSGNFYTRRRAPIHVCNRCKYEFDEPVSKEIPEFVDDFVLSENEVKKIAILKKTSVKFYTDFYPSIIASMIRKKYIKEIEKKTMLIYLDENIEYLSFENTKTFCKKCAFNYDKNGRDLCPKCKKNYKKIQYESCVDCLPEGELKDQIKKQQAEYKEMREYFKSVDEME
jgi:ribosomal protein L37AE/L43A